ncbi:uncharacterized protein LOC114521565 isoform X2 [Dendronephthya gigantea]|uniref:uncharacterized protein LOC114521565 isoform X2 n=1 Tax=Dendronephthya gigantea TaxID=151771 RepID=UPI001068E9C6|nr:uncharacterized protein LOC114521565 isoform X2 [Dendronephthya gigantea]
MWREIVTYNSSILVLNVIVDENAIAHLTHFTYEQKSNCFVLGGRKKQTIQPLQTNNGRNKISCLGFQVILDQYYGIFLPYFVAQDNKSCYLFCLDSNYEWLMRYKFLLPDNNMQLCDTSYSIENGPTLIWAVRNEIFIYRAEYLEKPVDDILRVEIDLNCELASNVVCDILWWDSSSEKGMVVVKDCTGNVINPYLISFDNKKRKANVTFTRQIIPLIYLKITTCTLAIPEYLSNEDKYSYRTFISTTHCQLLEFSNGKYVKHINIPLTSCQNIYMLESTDCEPILLCCQEDQICVVNWINSKIFKTYQVFSNVLIDDFIGLGTSQALLFNGLKYESYETFDNFILTDFSMIDIKRPKELNKKEDMSSTLDESSIDNVVCALIKKVQVTEASVIQCKMERSEKYSFLKKHCESLNNMLINDRASPVLQIFGLTELVVGQTTACEDVDVQYSEIVVRSKWQEITNSNWIIGVEVENIGPSLRNIIMCCEQNKRYSYVFLQDTSFRSQRSAKKNDGEGNVTPGSESNCCNSHFCTEFFISGSIVLSA